MTQEDPGQERQYGLADELLRLVLRTEAMLENSEKEGYIDTGDTIELLTRCKDTVKLLLNMPGVIRYVMVQEALRRNEGESDALYAEAKECFGSPVLYQKVLEKIRVHSAKELVVLAQATMADTLLSSVNVGEATTRAEQLSKDCLEGK